MEVKVYNTSGKATDKKINLDDSIFGIEPHEHSVYMDVKHILANKRQGTHKAKEVSELSGSTAKLYRQKGTGNARRGHVKSPLLRGGATAFGPRVRNYSFKLNKKVKRLARKSALSTKVKNDSLFVIDEMKVSQPKTKEVVQIINNFKFEGEKVLIVLDKPNKDFQLAARNLPNVKVTLYNNLNTYNIMNAKKLMVSSASIEKIQELFN